MEDYYFPRWTLTLLRKGKHQRVEVQYIARGQCGGDLVPWNSMLTVSSSQPQRSESLVDTIDRPLLWASYVRHISISSSSRVRGLEGGLCKRPIGFQLNTRSNFYFHPRLHGSVGSVVIYKVIDAWKSNSKFLGYLYHMLCF